MSSFMCGRFDFAGFGFCDRSLSLSIVRNPMLLGVGGWGGGGVILLCTIHVDTDMMWSMVNEPRSNLDA